MSLNIFDFAIVIVYFAVSFGLGLFLGRKGSSSIGEYFLSGRRAPWWLAGTGMVATTFAADTPLAVAGIVANNGVAGNWIWWSSAAGGMLTVFFFAKLWIRSGILTDLEFTELRYGGPAAAVLRGFKSVYFGLIINSVVIGWVNLAMYKILAILFPQYSPGWMLLCVVAATGIYVTISGLWGVAAADMFQFAIAMTGTVLLSVFAVDAVTTLTGRDFVSSLPPASQEFFPVFTSGASSADGMFRISLLSFVAFTAIQWWASWYPGAEPGGGGYIAQRIMSTRNEKEGFLATLWFVIAHYCVRPWPWIVAGLAAIVLYPDLAAGQKEEGYVYLIRDLLPSPYRGLLLAAFLGAYMSTLATQLNWGASYLVNDLYRRFFAKAKSARHYVRISRISTVLILAFSLYVTFCLLETISGAWKILLQFGAGSGFVLILRWYWWRINAVSEIVSMLVPASVVLCLTAIQNAVNFGAGTSSGTMSELLFRIVPDFILESSSVMYFLEFPNSLYVIVGITVLSVLITVFVTEPESKETLSVFYNRVRPHGPGWMIMGEPVIPGMGKLFVGWISGTAIVYSALFLMGSLLFHNYMHSAVYFAIFIVSAVFFRYALKED